MRNAVLEDLQDDELYAERLVDDVLTGGGTYGDVDAVEIPRPDGDDKHEAKGPYSCAFGDELFAEAAIEAFGDRSLNGKTILAGYYPEDLFKEKRFDSTPLPPVEAAPRAAAPSSEPAPTILAAQAVAAGVAGIGGVGGRAADRAGAAAAAASKWRWPRRGQPAGLDDGDAAGASGAPGSGGRRGRSWDAAGYPWN